jgi:hypothetical protein
MRLLRYGFVAFLLVGIAAESAAAQGFAGGGVKGAYFANATLSGNPSFTRTDDRIRFAWNGYAPGGSSTPAFAAVPASGFSARWTGTLIAPASGTFTFTTTTSGPARLWLTPPGGTQTEIIDYAGTSTATSTGKLALAAGKPYALVMEFEDMASPAVASLAWSGAGRTQAIIEPATPLGVNLTSNADWDGDRIFADAMKQSRGWCTPGSCASLIPTDEAGWPKQDFTIIPVAGPTELNGTYLMRFRGLAQVSINFGYGSFSVGGTNYGATLPSGTGYDAATNTTTATLSITPSQSINVYLNYTNTQRNAASAVNTGLTDIKMMRPKSPGAATPYGPGTLFTGGLESALAPFTAIRGMTYLNTNGSTIASWSDRVPPSAPIQAQFNGGALEYLVMLANETGKDLWVNVPVSASADYVTKLAQLLRFGSDGVLPYVSPQAHPKYPPVQPNLNIYVEYSNEVWNFSFAQASTNLQLAEAEVAAGGSPLNYDGSTNIYYWGWRRVAEQAVAISNIFRSVWGDAAMMTQIRPVLEWQQGDGQATADNQLNLLGDYYNNEDGIQHVKNPHPPSYYLWGAGAGWYHSVNNPGASTLDAIFASGLAVPSWVQIDAAYAHSFGLPEMGYEGGFEIGGDTPTALQLSADLDPRARAMEVAGLDYYLAQGGGLGMIFNVAGGSAYGLADPTVYDHATPKFLAAASVMQKAPPAVMLGNLVAGTVSLPTTLADVAHNLYGTFGTTVYAGPDTWLNWTLNVTAPGNYAITTNLGAVAGQEIVVDGVPISGVVALSAGVHGVHVYNIGSTTLALTTLILSKE